MKVDQDIVQRIKVIGIFTLQFYKVLMGTMLSLFVPQACYETLTIDPFSEQGSEGGTILTEGGTVLTEGGTVLTEGGTVLTEGGTVLTPETLQICSLSQNYENQSVYHQGAMYWNVLSFLCFVCSYILELRREEWAIKFLDIDNDKPDNSLKKIIISEPKLDKQMDHLNKMYLYALSITVFVYFVNVCLMINIIKNDYHSMSTISCFISFVMLVQMKLYNSLSVAYQSVKNDKMTSAFMSEFVSYNVIDKDYVLDVDLIPPLSYRP